jgi:hypothetical protein
MITVGEATSRVRNVLKAVKEDPFLTDRFLYSLIMKFGKTLIRRQDSESKIMMFHSLFKVIPCVDLIDVDSVEACCTGVRTGITFKRTKERLPDFMEGSKGPLIRSVASLDLSHDVQETYPVTYANMTRSTNFKYNKSAYYWFLDVYIYIPDVEWEAIRIEAIFDEDVRALNCANNPMDCIFEQDREIGIPDYLFSEIEQMVIQQFMVSAQVPSDGADDSQNAIR